MPREALALTIEIVLSCVLFLAGFSKLLTWRDWLTSTQRFEISLPRVFWWGLPFVELAIGSALALGIRPFGGIGAVTLFLLFAFGLALSYWRGSRADCGCFGPFLPTRVGHTATARALLLAVLGAALVVAGDSGPFRPVGLIVAITVTALALLVGSVLPILKR